VATSAWNLDVGNAARDDRHDNIELWLSMKMTVGGANKTQIRFADFYIVSYRQPA
jgi:hypothetical protein